MELNKEVWEISCSDPSKLWDIMDLINFQKASSSYIKCMETAFVDNIPYNTFRITLERGHPTECINCENIKYEWNWKKWEYKEELKLHRGISIVCMALLMCMAIGLCLGALAKG